MLLGMTKGCFELVLHAVYFLWYVFGTLFLFGFRIETICLVGARGIFTAPISTFYACHQFGTLANTIIVFISNSSLFCSVFKMFCFIACINLYCAGSIA